MTAGEVLLVALPFVWFGMVGAISFVETPLKFRAPGVTVPIGLGIGRIVFAALGRIEVAFLAALTVLMLIVGDVGAGAWAVLVGLWVIVLAQMFVVRPRLAHRTDAVIAGAEQPRSRLHLVFISLDLVKLVALFALGALLLDIVAS